MNNDLKAQYQRPEGKLLEDALRRARKSRRQLADDVELSEGRVRQIINGYKTEGGSVIPIVAPTDTVGRMAGELDIQPAQMSAAGREDVADYLRANPRLGITEEGDLWLSDDSQEKDLLRDWVSSGMDERPPPQALGLWTAEQLLEAGTQAHREEVRLLNYAIHVMRTRRKAGQEHGDSSAQKNDSEGLTLVPGDVGMEASDQDVTLYPAALEGEEGTLDEELGGSEHD